MALPTSIANTSPAGSDSPSQGDDVIRAFKLAVEDIFGIPDNTSITQAAMDIDAGGLAQVIFYDPAVEPASGELGRNGSTLYYRITDSRTATTTRPLGIIADTSGTPAASLGVGMLFQGESADEAPSDAGALDFVFSDVTAGSEDTYASIFLRVAGATLDEKYRFASTAGAGFTAIFTHAASADQTYTLPDATGTVALTAGSAHGDSAAVHGLPASVNVLGNRTAAGEFIQRTSSTVGSSEGAGTFFNQSANTAVTFAVAFATTPRVLATVQDGLATGACVNSVTTTGFNLRTFGQSGGIDGKSVAWLALGT